MKKHPVRFSAPAPNPDAMTPAGRAAFGILLLVCGALFMFAVSMCCGCCTTYKGAKVVEGTDLAIGVSIPSSDGMADLNVLNYLSGFRLGVAQNAGLSLTYTVAETNSYLGIVQTQTSKSIKARVEPCETAPAAR